MGYDQNGEWVEDDYGGGAVDDTYKDDWAPRDSNGTPNYDITPTDNADDHGKIDQPVDQPSGGNGGGGNSRDYEGEMKSKLGSLYTPGALEELRHHDYSDDWMSRIVNKENLRGDNEVGSTYHDDGKGGYLTGPVAPKSVILGSFGGGSRSGSGGGGGASGGSGGGVNKMDDVYGYLKGLFPGGAFNQDVVNRRLDSVRSGLNTSRNSTMKNNEAYLAERGLAGSGPQAEAANSLDSRLFGQFGSAYNDIYATESENADRRMMGALQAATGLSEAEAQNAIDQFRATTEHDLGFGNLAARNKEADQSYGLGLGNLNLGYTRAGNDFTLGRGNLAVTDRNNTNSYNLGAGRLQLDREQLAEIIRSGDADRLQKYLDQLQRGAETSSNGHY